jgi:hypothetical protein
VLNRVDELVNEWEEEELFVLRVISIGKGVGTGREKGLRKQTVDKYYRMHLQSLFKVYRLIC